MDKSLEERNFDPPAPKRRWRFKPTARLIPAGLIQKQNRKAFRIKMFYAFLYPYNSGIVIYGGLTAFSMVVTNITSLLPEMARGLYEGKFSVAGPVFLWLFAFFLGGFFAGWCVAREKLRNWRYLHLLPIAVVSAIFWIVGSAGPSSTAHHPVVMPAMLLFSIGIKNAMVSLMASNLLKASQITGVVNALGVDVAEIFLSEGDKRRILKREALLRIILMCSFILGALTSVAIFPMLHMKIFYIPASIMILIILHDIIRF